MRARSPAEPPPLPRSPVEPLHQASIGIVSAARPSFSLVVDITVAATMSSPSPPPSISSSPPPRACSYPPPVRSCVAARSFPLPLLYWINDPEFFRFWKHRFTERESTFSGTRAGKAKGRAGVPSSSRGSSSTNTEAAAAAAISSRRGAARCVGFRGKCWRRRGA